MAGDQQIALPVRKFILASLGNRCHHFVPQGDRAVKNLNEGKSKMMRGRDMIQITAVFQRHRNMISAILRNEGMEI
ncbi:hypothetical protein [Novosphingobium sp. Leaf2]|uniref:hypothetical protein n=1 Tax=Novosphingobium sp. Leaf2 TaxID=1735670 RepID=UPI0006FE28ED|nr:hypothetical protein [Novosphingobium sp. Leaf2]KQM20376.1 hypothetical protein ASE49_16895 [Novosphingobium sp. Leaf2]